MKKVILTIESMQSTLAALKKLGIEKDPETLTRKDLFALTQAGVTWDLPADEVPKGELAKFQNAKTKPGRSKKKPSPEDTDVDIDYDDWHTKTQIDNFTSTDVMTRVADKLASNLASADYRSMSPDELKAAIEIELKNYLTK